MILRRLHLPPFAGAADREVILGPGLNVVLGPNEAGKSTLRRALRQVLFIPTKLGKRESEAEVSPHLPLGGGDTIRVSLDFEIDGALWKLTKRWGGGQPSSELLRPDGGVVTDPAAVEETLASLLGLSRGTWERILFSAQGDVGNSLDRLDTEGDLRELNERLRRSVFETDGVSLEQLAEAIEARRAAVFGRWDPVLKRPEGNRGLDQRWTRGAGTIVNAWYEQEAARRALEAAEQYYRHLDEINVALVRATAANEELAGWVGRHEPIARDAQQRAFLEAELAGVAAKGKGLKEISQEWPVLASEAAAQESLAESLRGKVALLGEELSRSRAWEAAAKSRRIVDEAEKLSAAVAGAKAARDAVGGIDAEAVAAIEKLERERERIRVRIEAAALRVRVAAGRATSLETRSGVGDSVIHELDAGGELTFGAGGRVLVREAGGAWEIEVSSGEIDVAAEEEQHRTLSGQRLDRLQSLGVPDLEAARQRLATWRDKTQRLALLEDQLAALLGSRTIEQWKEEVARAGGIGGMPVRPLAEVAAEHARCESEGAAAVREASSRRQKIAVWEKELGSPDALLDTLADLRSDHKTLKQKIEALLPLPDGYQDAAAFLHEFRTRQESLGQRRAELHRIQIEKAELSKLEPELEPAEASERLVAATAAFARACREGEAVERIARDFETLRGELDQGTLAPWQDHLSVLLGSLTADRYRGLSPDEATAARADGPAVPFAVLSTGTRACLGLAVRLAMARWFLEDRDGFLLLDDPMVDLDPVRQDAAAELLRRFAGEKQVVLFTCHPTHAGLLGGSRVEL
jgi:exonuclease SbcC